MLTRARGKGTGEDSDGIVVRAGLGSAITDTISVVGLGAETFIVAGRAAQLASLGFHVAEAHLCALGDGHGSTRHAGSRQQKKRHRGLHDDQV